MDLKASIEQQRGIKLLLDDKTANPTEEEVSYAVTKLFKEENAAVRFQKRLEERLDKTFGWNSEMEEDFKKKTKALEAGEKWEEEESEEPPETEEMAKEMDEFAEENWSSSEDEEEAEKVNSESE